VPVEAKPSAASRRAISAPMPFDAPVSTATLPLSFVVMAVPRQNRNGLTV